MSPETYIIDDPPNQMIVIKPIDPYSIIMNPTSVIPVVGDSRLVISYDVIESNTNTRPSWIKSYN